MDVTIDRVETIPFSIPYAEPKVFATGSVTSADYVLVRVVDADGAVGNAEAIPRAMIHGETVGTVLAVYDEVVRSCVLGRSIWDGERIHDDLERTLVGNHAARCAFEMALYDLVARRLGVSCHRLLGGVADSVAVSGHLVFGDVQRLMDRAVELHETYGITSFKVKIGVDLDRDVQLLTALSETLPTASISGDANHGYTALQAMRFAERTAGLGLDWIEEPMPAADVLGRQRVAATSMNILSDESTTTPETVAKEILERRTHLVSIKVPRTGYRDSDRIRVFCEMTGTGVVIGGQGETGLGTLASLAFAAAHAGAARHPTELSTFIELTDDLLADPIEIKGGRIFVPAGPGNGAILDEEKLRRYGRSAG